MSKVKNVEVKSNAGKGKGKGSTPAKAIVKITSHANGADFSESRPGVLAFFVTQLLKAYGKGGLTKKQLLALTLKEFPDRTEAKVKSTIAMQLPSGFYIEKGYVLTVENGDEGRAFSLSPKAKAAGDAWRIAKRTNPEAVKPVKPTTNDE